MFLLNKTKKNTLYLKKKSINEHFTKVKKKKINPKVFSNFFFFFKEKKPTQQKKKKEKKKKLTR